MAPGGEQEPSAIEPRESSKMSPKSARHLTDEGVAIQVQQFLDDWHYRIMHSTLGKKWTRKKCISAALDLLALNGIPMSPAEIPVLADMEEHAMIPMLVDRMSPQVREAFDSKSQELQLLVNTAANIRNAIDQDQEKVLQDMVENSDQTVIGQQILKQAVIGASKDVAKILRCQDTWVKNMESRLDRLTRSSDLAEHAHQQLLAVEMQLERFGATQNGKSKAVLMGFAESNNKSLIHSVFSSWLGQYLSGTAERAIRKKFENEIYELENRLIDLKQQQMANVKGVLMRNARQGDEGLVAMCLDSWKEAWSTAKAEGAAQSQLNEINAQLNKFKGDQADKRKSVMARMGADQNSGLLAITWNCFVQFHQNYQKDKEFEDAVKRQEAKIQDHMKRKKEEAKTVLDRMSGATDAGLMAQQFQAWWSMVLETRKAAEMDAAMNGGAGRFKSLRDRQSNNAQGVQGRVNEQVKMNLLLRCTKSWQIEARVNKENSEFTRKLDQKRKQLKSVQQLFKEFARQLEEGLGNVDGDSSGRTSAKSRKMKDAGGGSVSLPNIHQKQGVSAN